MNTWTHIGNQIKTLRESQSLTQSDLADRIGASKQYISNLENGSKKCSVQRLSDIAAELQANLTITIK